MHGHPLGSGLEFGPLRDARRKSWGRGSFHRGDSIRDGSTVDKQTDRHDKVFRRSP